MRLSLGCVATACALSQLVLLVNLSHHGSLQAVGWSRALLHVFSGEQQHTTPLPPPRRASVGVDGLEKHENPALAPQQRPTWAAARPSPHPDSSSGEFVHDSGADTAREIPNSKAPRRPLVCTENCTISGEDNVAPSREASEAMESEALLRHEQDSPRSTETGLPAMLRPRTGGSRGLRHAVMSLEEVSSATTMTSVTSTVVFCDTSSGSLTVTLPSATTMGEGANGMRYFTIVNKATANTCTVQTSSSQLIYMHTLVTASFADTSSYSRLYGGSSATSSTAAFSDTSTMTNMYLHNTATLPVTSNFNAAPGTTSVVSSISVSTTPVQSSVTSTSTSVIQSRTTSSQQCVYGYSHSSTSFLTGFSVLSTGTAVRNNGISTPTTTAAANTVLSHNHAASWAYGKWVSDNADGPSDHQYDILVGLTLSGISDSPVPRTFVNGINFPVTAPVVRSTTTNSANAISSISYSQNAACIGGITTSSTPVLNSVTNSPTNVVQSFSPTPTTVVTSLPSISSSATLSSKTIATSVKGNVAVSHDKFFDVATSLTGIVTISEQSSYSSTTSLVLQPGASITLISDGSAWYQLGGTFGTTTSL